MSLLKELMNDKWNIFMDCRKNPDSAALELKAAGTKEIDELPFPIHFDVEGSSFEKLFKEDELESLISFVHEGWNIEIECKGKHREYGMTFEASATKRTDSSSYPIQYHVVADSFVQLVEKLKEQEKDTQKAMMEFSKENAKTLVVCGCNENHRRVLRLLSE